MKKKKKKAHQLTYRQIAHIFTSYYSFAFKIIQFLMKLQLSSYYPWDCISDRKIVKCCIADSINIKFEQSL